MFASVDFISTIAATSAETLQAATGIIKQFPAMDKLAGLTQQALSGMNAGAMAATQAIVNTGESLTAMTPAGMPASLGNSRPSL